MENIVKKYTRFQYLGKILVHSISLHRFKRLVTGVNFTTVMVNSYERFKPNNYTLFFWISRSRTYINNAEVSYQTDGVVLDVFEDQGGDQCSAPLNRWIIWKLSAMNKRKTQKFYMQTPHKLYFYREKEGNCKKFDFDNFVWKCGRHNPCE